MGKNRGLARAEVERVIALDSDECQLWPFATFKDGYGKIRVGDKWLRTHRYVFERVNGISPEVVRHTCDTPLCCNPKHLLGGTHADNMADKKERGRGYKSKLVASQVLEIRSSYDNNADELAEKYGVTIWQILNIIRRRNWQHV